MRREAMAAGRGAALAVEDAGDDVVGIVDGEATQQVDGVVIGADLRRGMTWQVDGGAGDRAAVPADGQDGDGTRPVDGNRRQRGTLRVG
jgi:hypothetical protein